MHGLSTSQHIPCSRGPARVAGPFPLATDRDTRAATPEPSRCRWSCSWFRWLNPKTWSPSWELSAAAEAAGLDRARRHRRALRPLPKPKLTGTNAKDFSWGQAFLTLLRRVGAVSSSVDAPVLLNSCCSHTKLVSGDEKGGIIVPPNFVLSWGKRATYPGGNKAIQCSHPNATRRGTLLRAPSAVPLCN